MTDSWRSAICERCWLTHEPYTVHIAQDNPRLPPIIQIKVPVRVVPGDELELEVCGYCGEPTIWGVFVRVDPSTIPYPALAKP